MYFLVQFENYVRRRLSLSEPCVDRKLHNARVARPTTVIIYLQRHFRMDSPAWGPLASLRTLGFDFWECMLNVAFGAFTRRKTLRMDGSKEKIFCVEISLWSVSDCFNAFVGKIHILLFSALGFSVCNSMVYFSMLFEFLMYNHIKWVVLERFTLFIKVKFF